ncbi:hypothetical protein HDU78_006851 [Chytriomyces hyalinus]|nr:hypothetical protein HDU78_006851 [Chytriomyces hyalinus]KAJ3263254.1 hypothetical protein HDU77_011036 [Chytriomyces hyalinus]KAJ3399273.1 hypothetical protein HDU80_008108 [Chytriomyces hyalinus]
MTHSEIEQHIVGLEKQLAQLKAIVYGSQGSDNAATSTTNAAKDQELEKLKLENKKLDYRIKQLLRTVSEKRARINELEGRK